MIGGLGGAIANSLPAEFRLPVFGIVFGLLAVAGLIVLLRR